MKEMMGGGSGSRFRSLVGAGAGPVETPPPAPPADWGSAEEAGRPPLHVLVVDDDADVRETLATLLDESGHRVTPACDGKQAMALLSANLFDVILTDIRMPTLDGLALLRHVRRESPATDVIVMSGYGSVTDAVAALKEGARDYVAKPFASEEILVRLRRLREQRALRRELAQPARAAGAERQGPAIIGHSAPMVRLLERIDTLAQSDAPVLITGESGTGKELVARSLHDLGSRAGGRFVAVNCAAFPESLLEAELFGHERGAFTGAVKKRDGRFRAADGGTLLLDEISEIPLPAQAKLLRVLQSGVIEPLGTNTSIRVDVRVISASNRSLKECIAEGRFREDLYYRLKVLDIEIPPLRERPGDLLPLLHHFLCRLSTPGVPLPGISPAALAALYDYRFPGNVRELEHAVEHAIVLSRGSEIDLVHLPVEIVGRSASGQTVGPALRPLGVAVREFEREYLVRTLARVGGRRGRAAEMLGISRKTLWEKLRLHGLVERMRH